MPKNKKTTRFTIPTVRLRDAIRQTEGNPQRELGNIEKRLDEIDAKLSNVKLAIQEARDEEHTKILGEVVRWLRSHIASHNITRDEIIIDSKELDMLDKGIIPKPRKQVKYKSEAIKVKEK